MFDLDSRVSKLEKERQQRLNKIKQQQQAEQRKQREFQERQAQLEAIAQQNREREEALRIEREEQEAKWLQMSGGVKFHKIFTEFYLLNSDEEEPDNDKITLPEEALNELMSQDVLSRFPVMLFRLDATLSPFSSPATASNGSAPSTGQDERLSLVTHAGVKEFSAPPQRLGLPRKVLSSLGGDLSRLASISVRFVLLPKCTYAKLRPRQNRFFEVQPVKRCLEENLRLHATLTAGDTLTVWYRGAAHAMTVVELRPAEATTVIDTDVEIDLDLSEESQQQQHHHHHQQQQQQTSRTLASSLTSSSSSSYASPAAIDTSANNFRPPMMSSAVAPSFSVQFYSPSLLLPEIDAKDTISLTCKFKLPSNKTAMRRFSLSAPLLQLFLFVSAEMGLTEPSQAAEQQRLVLSTRFPARSLAFSDVETLQKTLSELGFGSGSEQFFVTFA